MRALGTSLVVAPLSRQKMGFSLDTWNNAKIHSDQSETYIKSTYTLTLVFLEILHQKKEILSPVFYSEIAILELPVVWSREPKIGHLVKEILGLGL